MRIPASRFGRTAIAALVGVAVVHALVTIQSRGELPIFALVIELVFVGLAVLVATGRWMACVLAGLLSGLVFAMSLAGSADRLTPGDPLFVGITVFLAVTLLATVTALMHAVELRRERRA